MYLSTRSYASDSSSPISISILSTEIARLASLWCQCGLVARWSWYFCCICELNIKKNYARIFGLLTLLSDDSAIWIAEYAIVPLRFDDFYTPITVELRSRRLIIVRTLVLEFALCLEKNEKTNCRVINSVGSLFLDDGKRQNAEGVNH